MATLEEIDDNVDIRRYFEEERNLRRNAYYEMGNYYFLTDSDKAINNYKEAFKYCATNRERTSTVADTADLSKWADEGKFNAPCYYVAYNIACASALRHDRSDPESVQKNIELSLSWLKVALELNFPNLKHLYQDEDIRVLRNEYSRRFNELINSYSDK